MLLKIILSVFMCAGTWFFGKCYSDSYKEKIRLIEEYIDFMKEFKSAVHFSGIDMFSFFSKNEKCYTKNLCEIILKNKEIGDLNAVECNNLQEKRCIKIISDALLVAEKSSDVDLISGAVENSIEQLENFKKQSMEEYCGKIKIAPSVGLIFGIFVAVIII